MFHYLNRVWWVGTSSSPVPTLQSTRILCGANLTTKDVNWTFPDSIIAKKEDVCEACILLHWVSPNNVWCMNDYFHGVRSLLKHKK